MQFQSIFGSTPLAHAYLIFTNDTRAGDTLVSYLCEQKLVEKGSPDIFLSSYQSLGIEDVRSLIQFASLKPISGQKYVIISANQITTEAQSALLKSVEEGVGHSTFFFILQPGSPILTTLQSRCVTVKDTESKKEENDLGNEFLSMSYKDRLQHAEKLGKNSDREGAQALVRSLLVCADSKTLTKGQLRDLLDANRYLQLSGSSPKGVIGHLALVL